MKTYVDLHSQSEFELVVEIRSVLELVTKNRFSGNYFLYQIKSFKSLSGLYFGSKIENKKVGISLCLKNLKLDYAIQVWEIAQSLTKQKYPDYLDYEWIKTINPTKELSLKSNNRKKAEDYFYQMLKETCNDINIITSEIGLLNPKKLKISEECELPLLVIINENEITDEILHKITNQFEKNEIHYTFDLKNQKFTFDEIKEYFVYCDIRLLCLLNAADGQKDITEAEKLLFKAALNLDLEGILIALKKGANINAIDLYGETAFTNIFQHFDYAQTYSIATIDEVPLMEKTMTIAKKNA